MTDKLYKSSLSRRAEMKAKHREKYLLNIEKTLWQEKDIPKLPMISVADLASELFSSTCGARKLAGLHLPEAIDASFRGRISPCSLVLALLYLERLKSGGEMATEYLCEVSPSELFIVSMLVANKFLQDEGDSEEMENWYWADMSGFDLDHINTLEKEFLAAMDWNVYVGQKEFWQRIDDLHRRVSMRDGCRRHWFTYEEMFALLNVPAMTSICSTLLQVSAVCLVSYAAAVLTMVGAAVTTSHIQQYIHSLTINQTPKAMLHNSTALNLCPMDSWSASDDIPSTVLADNASLPISFFYNDTHGDYEASISQDVIFNPWQIVAFLTTVSSHDQLIREVRHEVALLQLKEFI